MYEQTALLIVSSNRSLVRHVTRALASAGYPVESCSLRREQVVSALSAPRRMCIIDADEDHGEIRWLLTVLFEQSPETIPLLLSHDYQSPFLMDLIASEQLSNLIARHGGVTSTSDVIDENELIVTCQKLFHRDIFGMEKYLPTWGVKIHTEEVAGTDDRRMAIRNLEGFLDRIDCYGSIKSAIALVADELLMNAIFNAPRDSAGNAKYADLDRRARVELPGRERVTFRYACDGRNVALSVKDQFGSLDRQVIVKYLQHCFSDAPAEIEEKKAGAGLGLYLVFNSITQLTFNVQTGVATEVVAAFYIRSGTRAFKSSGRSLNLFLVQ